MSEHELPSLEDFLAQLEEAESDQDAFERDLFAEPFQVTRSTTAAEAGPSTERLDLPAPANWQLEVVSGTLAGEQRSLQETITIGREQDVDLIIDELRVSRWHARLEMRADGPWIVDQDSSNGTYVNAARISKPLRLFPGDEIRIGETRLRISGPEAQSLQSRDAAPPTELLEPSVSDDRKKFCIQCGQTLKPGLKFCTQCGARNQS